MSSEPDRTSPLDPQILGWHIVPRAWDSSALCRSLRTAEARHVAELVLFKRPRFKDETHYFGGRAFLVRRGQLFDSEETLANEAGTSRKVVRTVLRDLLTAGVITREKVHPSGQCPHVITVLDYELSQTLPGNGARERAGDGPETGQRRARERAPSKPQEPHQPQEQGGDPRHGELMGMLRRVGEELRPGFAFNGGSVGKAAKDFLAESRATVEQVEERYRAFLADPKQDGDPAFFLRFKWNHYERGIRAARGVRRVIADVSDWSDPRAGDFT